MNARSSRLGVWSFGLCAAFLATIALGFDSLIREPVRLDVVHVFAAVVVVLALLSAAGDELRDRIGPEPVRPLLWGAALVGLAALSAITSITPTTSFRIAGTMLLGLGVAVAILLVSESPHHLRRLIAVCCCGSVPVTLLAVGEGGMIVRRAGAVVEHRPQSFFGHPNELGAYAAIVLLMSIGWLICARGRYERWAATAAAASASCALVLSLSRGAWVGAALGFFTLAVLHAQVRRVVVVVGVAVVLVVAVGLVRGESSDTMVLARVASVRYAGDNPDDQRPDTWHEGIRQFAARPITGQGPGTFREASSTDDSFIQHDPRSSAHNLALNTAAELGLAGLIALGCLAVSIGVAVRRRARALRADGDWRDLGLLSGCAAALVTILGQGLVDDTIVSPVMMMFAWSVVGLTLAAARGARAGVADPPRSTGGVVPTT